MPLGRINEVVEAIGRALARGERAYWVCPLVAESETSDLADTSSATSNSSSISAPRSIWCTADERADKDAAMGRFASGETQLLSPRR